MFLKIINFLTISRIIIGVIIFILLAFDRNALLSFVLFLFAGLTDYFDGFLARKYKLTSQFGEITDPIADKILIVFVLFWLSINLSSYLIGFAGSIIISREIWVSALRDFNARNNNSSATKVTFLAKLKSFLLIFKTSFMTSAPWQIKTISPLSGLQIFKKFPIFGN